ncbi:CTP synthetase [Alisedimentitalea sp. MJ-SS2]|uniref:CTP synthetase n=1 Tax=Aliisedimentitalea sp. MJ-SS2 TaxID=3049795 RepID=UPI002906FCC4|nr:CTP synthetase [Alisedimentitalea sp. MJ-SS2]MDU8929887.1 CTP synthetase [Alisedimentitalea sp. MJ-SS2]
MFLVFIVHLFLGATLAGSAVVAGLTMGYDTMQPVIVAALIGWVISIPATFYVAKLIRSL